MRIGIFLFLMLASICVSGDDMQESVSIQKVNNQFAINYFNYKPEILAYFESVELQGGGYTWEALVRAAVSTEAHAALAEIEFDSEGDAFVAYTANESVANKVKEIIERLSSDISYREKYIKLAGSEGYLE